MTLALTTVELLWSIALALGLVVAFVVALLLEVLRRSVHTVRRAVDDVLNMGARLAQNTWTVQILQTATQRIDKLLTELGHRRPTGESSGG